MNAAAHFQVAPIFQNEAVLQRDQPIPVWGRAQPGTTITARVDDRPEAHTAANDDGTWLLRLPPLPGGGPYTLAIRCSDGDGATFTDLLAGDVWICSGQSNMEFSFAASSDADALAAGFDFPQIRFLTVHTSAKADRQSAVGGRWTRCSPSSVMPFSAVAAWFGKTIHEHTGIPIGLIANAWGGTRIQAWLSREALATTPEGRSELAAYETALYASPTARRTYLNADEWFRAEGPENPANLGAEKSWHLPAFDDSSWPTMLLPSRWQSAGHHFNGVFWFRRKVAIPREWLGKTLQLNLGAVDKHDDTYADGTRVGGLSWETPNSWCTARHYAIPPGAISGTELTIAVRARSHLYHGGMTGPASAMTLHPEGDASAPIPLAGHWRYAVEQNWGVVTPPPSASDNSAPGGQNAPYTLHHSRLAPLIPYAIRGFTWYQGESNAGEPALYRRLLPLMIADWRRAWGQGDLPFLIVQLANYMPAQENPAESGWAELRDAQRAALSIPNTGLAVTIDIGDADDIHPTNKRDVGLRLARWALSDTYAAGGPPSGPLFRRAERLSGGRVRILFDHASGLRTADGGPVRHAAIASPDGVFRWAAATIENDALIVSHPDVPIPAAVRYAWADNPAGCNLTNAAGLPASPFESRDF